MSLRTPTEAAVERELLSLALHNAGRSVPAQLFVVAYLVWLAWYAGHPGVTEATVVFGGIGVVWRAWIAHRYSDTARLSEGDIRIAQRSLEGNAALAGLLWVLTTFGVYANLQGQQATSYMVVACGSMSVAAYFMSLVGHSFVLLAVPQLGAILIASLVFEPVRSVPLAGLIVLFGLTMLRAAREFTHATTRAVRHGLEADAANESLQRAKEVADAANTAKSQFLATISHEIRTPMNGVLGALELLRRSRLDAQQRRLVRTAASSGESLMGILNDVLDHSKIEAGKLHLSHAPLSLRDTAKSVVALFRANAQAKDLTLSLDVDPDVADAVLGDAQRLKQVLLNLVGNAIKFTERGGVALRLSCVRRGSDRVHVRFEVIDSGIGIPQAALQRLFEPFHQVDGSRSRRAGGTGLGLAISQRIVEAMGGIITVESQPGSGSSFHFELRFDPDPDPVVGMAQDSSMAALDNLPSSMAGTVLVVEDNPVNRVIAEEMLQSLGLEIVEAQDGSEALDLLTRRSVDLVLMDCQMPVMDGYTAATRIRELETSRRMPRTPIIALTADAYEEDSARALQAGMDAHLAKPYTRDQLREVISAWI